MLKAAISGLGWWGRTLSTALNAGNEKIRIVRGVDVDAEGARAFADEMGFPLYGNLQEALDDAEVDAVILTTPHSLHAGQIVQAAQAGKHVFCEKPLALNKADAERAVSACEDAGVVLGLGHERRFEPAMQEIKRLVDSGELGTILYVESNFSHDSLATVPAGNWRVEETDAPAAGMTATGIHLTDSYINMLGPIEQVRAQTARRVMTVGSGDVLSVQFRFASGALGYLNSILATPFFMRFHVFGSEGWVEARDTVRPEVEGVTYLTVRRKDGEPETREMPSLNTAILNLEAFAEAARGGTPYPFTPAEMVHNIATLEAITASAKSGNPVAVL